MTAERSEGGAESVARAKEVLYDSETVLRLVDRELEELLEELGDGARLRVVLGTTIPAAGVPESPAHDDREGGRADVKGDDRPEPSPARHAAHAARRTSRPS